ncbi:MAG: ArgE/DapE family deacylase [Deltaproteobacteria bacterium]|nr:ArgE/DapE family deacylase [Deltaproteobacteria bacterium]
MEKRVLFGKLKEQILSFRDEAVRMLCDLVAIPSISGQEGEIQKELCKRFSRLEGEARLIPIKESLRSDPDFASGIKVPFEDRPQTRYFWKGRGDGKSLIACAHVDVVGPGDWKEAFEPRVEEDLVYGRGAVDDKAAIVSIFFALKALQTMGIHLLGDTEVHLTNEEEVGMAGALAFVREGFRADGVLVLEPTDHRINIAHRGCLQFTIEVEGKQAHLGNKRYGVNAIEKAAKVIDALVKYEDRLIEEGRGYPLFEDFEYPGQVNVGIIKGGDFFSIVPDAVTMEGGVGFLPMKTMEGVERELVDVIRGIEDSWVKDHVRVRYEGLKNEPYQMPEGHPFTEALRETLRSLGRDVEVRGMMASCDARYYYNQGGMPSIVYGGYNERQAHSKNEHVQIPDLLETAYEYGVFLTEWCGTAA